MILLLIRLVRMDFDTAMDFCPEEAQAWLEDALDVLKKTGPLY